MKTSDELLRSIREKPETKYASIQITPTSVAGREEVELLFVGDGDKGGFIVTFMSKLAFPE